MRLPPDRFLDDHLVTVRQRRRAVPDHRVHRRRISELDNSETPSSRAFLLGAPVNVHAGHRAETAERRARYVGSARFRQPAHVQPSGRGRGDGRRHSSRGVRPVRLGDVVVELERRADDGKPAPGRRRRVPDHGGLDELARPVARQRARRQHGVPARARRVHLLDVHGAPAPEEGVLGLVVVQAVQPRRAGFPDERRRNTRTRTAGRWGRCLAPAARSGGGAHRSACCS